jgi:hypothetical protein
MSAKEYAEENAGRRIRVYVKAAGPNSGLVAYPYCRVVGWQGNKICVEFEDVRLHQYCANPNMVGCVRTSPSTPGIGIWIIEIEQVRFLKQSKTPKPTVPVKPYPHTCVVCKSPARNCASYVLCSNSKCKANKKFRKMVMANAPQITRIKCPTCKRNAIEVGAARNKDKAPEWRFNCDKKHIWAYVPKENDVVSCGVDHKPGAKDKIWRTNGWQLRQ